MKYLSLLPVLAALFSCAQEQEQADVLLEGELVWDRERQVLSPCDSDAVYWLRVLASNLHFRLARRAEELKSESPGAAILVKLEGVVKPVTSAGPNYPVDGVFYVHRIIFVEVGSCP